MNIVDDKSLWDVYLSRFQFPALAFAESKGLFESLRDGPIEVEELCARHDIEITAAKSLLTLLAALDFVTVEDGSVDLTVTSKTYLLSSSPYYWGPAIKLLAEFPITLSIIADAFTKAKDKFRGGYGSAFGTSLAPKHGEFTGFRAISAAYSDAMKSMASAPAEGVAQLCDFESVQHVLDVGGGLGTLSLMLAAHHKQLCCTVLDRPSVCRQGEREAHKVGFAPRVRYFAADMFRDDWPPGSDAVLFSNIFHDWNDARCAALARKSFEYLPIGGKIFLHEMLLNDSGSGPLWSASFSMNMLIFSHGRQFKRKELFSILKAAGFSHPIATESFGYYSMISATK